MGLYLYLIDLLVNFNGFHLYMLMGLQNSVVVCVCVCVCVHV